MAARFATADDCIPAGPLAPDGVGDVIEPNVLVLALDSYAGALVLCSQAWTRRNISVFFDRVSYACWQIDPKTAALHRRADLGRSYWACQDGNCEPAAQPTNAAVASDGAVVSRDGTEWLIAESSSDLQIYARTAAGARGALVRSFPRPAELVGKEPLPGELALVGHSVIAAEQNKDAFIVLDDRGVRIAELAGTQLHVIDDARIAVWPPEDRQPVQVFDLRTREQSAVTSPFVKTAVGHAGSLFAIDAAKRSLIALTPAFAVRASLPLKTCR